MFSWIPARSLLLLIFWGGWLFAQNDGGELRLKITDASGLGLKCRVELTNAANQVHAIFMTDEAGALAIHRLPLGTYSLRVSHRGFAELGKSVEIGSAVTMQLLSLI